MRVLVIPHGNIPSRWAHSFQAMQMAAAFQALGHEVEVLARGALLGGRLHRTDLARWYGVRPLPKVVRLPVHRRLNVASFRDVGQGRFDVLAGAYAALRRPHLVWARSLAAGLLSARAGVPTVIEVHGIPDSSPRVAEGFARLARALDNRQLRAVVTVTPYLARRYQAAGLNPAKLQVLPDAVDPGLFQGVPPAAVARQRLGWPEGVPTVVYAGHLYPEKGIPTLLQAAQHLPEARFVLVGGWPEDVARWGGSRHNIIFTGFVERKDLPLRLAAADVLVLPNSARYEHAWATSPLKLYEYWASGRPVVASHIPALAEINAPQAAQWVTPDDPQALAAGLRAVLDSPERGRALAVAGRERVAGATWTARARALIQRALES